MAVRARHVWMILAGLGVAVLVAGGIWLFAFRDRARPINEEALSLTVVTGAGAPGDPGVYTYTTTGREATDALAGSEHVYPAETYLTIQPGGCGNLVRWQPLEERYEEWEICSDGTLTGFVSFHEWFRVANTDVWDCADPAPLQGEPGQTWSTECTRVSSQEAGEGSRTVSYEAVGFETLVVGDEEVETLHVRASTLERGGTEGYRTSEMWFLPGTDLLVRWIEDASVVTQSRIGAVAYTEQFEVILESLRPGS